MHRSACRRRKPAKPLVILEVYKIVLAAPFGLLLGWIAVEMIQGHSPAEIARKAEQAVARFESSLR